MLARKRHGQMFQAAGLGVQAHARVRTKVRVGAEAARELNILVHHAQIGANFCGDIAEHFFNIGWRIKDQRGYALLENTCFFTGN